MRVADITRETAHHDFVMGPWLVQPEANCIRSSSGTRRSLEPRIMALLCLLADNAGHVLTRDSLMASLWPHVVVNENSLTRAVSELRKTLNCPEAAGETFVSTIPKRGYRLDVTVSPVAGAPLFLEQRPAETPPAVTIDAAQASPAQPPDVADNLTGALVVTRNRKPGALQAMAASLVLAAAVFWQGAMDNAPEPASVSHPQPESSLQLAAATSEKITHNGTDSSPPAAEAETGSADWLREQLRTHRAEGLGASAGIATRGPYTAAPDTDSPVAADASTSVFSRDGQLFAYVSYTDAGSSLVLGAREGFSPVNVYETDELIFNLQWSPVDNILLFAQRPKLGPATVLHSEQPVRLVMFDIATMEATLLHGGEADKETANRPFSLT